MNNQDYEQKKAECWDDYTRKSSHDGKSAYGAFLFTFDRAYALGKQTETITQNEIEKAAEDYAYNIGESDWERLRVRDAFKDGADFALGKQDKDAEDTVTIDKEEYDKLCKYRRYAANWYWNFTTCPECGEYNPSGCICANCNNDKNWNK